MEKVHKWSEDDASIALYYERFGVKGLSVTIRELAESVIGTSVASLKMMCGNFQYLREGRGFEHYSIAQVKAFDQYSKISYEEYKDIIFNILDKRDLSQNKKEYSKRVKEQNFIVHLLYN